MRETPRPKLSALLIGAVIVALCATTATAPAQQMLQYAYDELGRLKTVTYPDGKQIVYQYDAAGNRTQHIVSATIVDNHPPVAAADSIYAANSSGYWVSFDPRWNDSDADSHALTITAKTNGAKGTVTIGGGGTSLIYSLTATPPPSSQYDSDSFTYTISDVEGAIAIGYVDVVIYTECPPVPPGQEFCQIE